MAHRHTAKTESNHYGFSTCANPYNCDPVAHGNISLISFCGCGASRRENHNAGKIECGEWRDKQSTHYSNFGVTMQPREADGSGYVDYREGYNALPRNQWTPGEAWIASHEDRINDWRTIQ